MATVEENWHISGDSDIATYTMNPRGLRDLDSLGNHKHPCASRAGIYIGFRGHLDPVDPSVSS